MFKLASDKPSNSGIKNKCKLYEFTAEVSNEECLK